MLHEFVKEADEVIEEIETFCDNSDKSLNDTKHVAYLKQIEHIYSSLDNYLKI